VLNKIHPEVLFVVLAGILSLFILFYFSTNVMLKKLPRFTLPLDTNRINTRPLLWLLLIGHIAFNYLPVISTLSSIGQFLVPAGYLSFGGFYLLWRRGRLSNYEKLIIILVCLPLEIYWRIQFSLLTDILLFLIFIIFLVWRERQYNLLVLFCVLVVSILSIYGASTITRTLANPGIERLILVGKFFVAQMFTGETSLNLKNSSYIYNKYGVRKVDRYIKNKLLVLKNKMAPIVKRTSQLWIYHVVDDKSPYPVNYWKGKTYRPLLTSFIPRVFWPEKPEERAGNEFGQRYGIVMPNETTTSINLPWITELLANFGRWGVISGMALIGIFLAFLDRWFNSKESSDLEFVFGLTIIFPLVYPESNFSVMAGSMLPLFVSLYIYITGGSWFLQKIPWYRKFNN
jgi:hypothetical protein